MFHLIVLGKLKETYWKEAEAEYLKRLRPLLKLTIHELKEESFGEKDSSEKIKSNEALKIKSILERIPDAFVVALDEHGQNYSSTELSERLQSWKELGQNIVLIMGGPLGLHESILQLAKSKLSLSRLTFTHQMARVILLEQLYRGCMIQVGRNYHY